MLVRRFYDLPSLTALAAFEAAARHKSFNRAAAELNVTPGAVSRQIKSLEDGFGVPLFVRSKDGVTPTPDADELYTTISNGFARASETIQRIKTGNRTRRVTIACTNAVASMWLMPRMGDFWRRFPDIVVDHLISDDGRDFRRAEVDLRIRYGLGAWPDERAELLLSEIIYPVASPRFAAQHEGATAGDISALPLLHVDWVDPTWTGWDELFRRAGIPHGPLGGRRFSTFAVAIQACRDDQGVAVGWHRLLRDQVAAGALVAFTDLVIPAPGSYHLTWNEARSLSPGAEVMRDWLVETARDDKL